MILAIVISLAILICLCWICLCRASAKVSRMERKAERELPEGKEEMCPLRPMLSHDGEVDNWKGIINNDY